jgi:tetratricopeptide (TPR) repeat protein
MHKNKPDAFSAKWLGIIDLSKNKFLSAIKYMENSLKYSNDDPQVLFNLAGAYAKMQKFDLALKRINDCLKINPNFPKAANLKNQLVQIVKQ